MDLFSSVVVMATSLVGSVVMTVCGFGFGGVVMAVWPYIMPYSQSVAVAALCGFTTAFIVVVTNFRYINYKILVPCMITGLIAAAAAVAVSVGAAEKVMMRSLGVALMA
ncbi:MAG: sulfite exporter TauE/SafE family protein, partial [Pyramidobacter sp.]|nr:sulfite exporter TauE/SafE family protein [Pyramidobacter sp.]